MGEGNKYCIPLVLFYPPNFLGAVACSTIELETLYDLPLYFPRDKFKIEMDTNFSLDSTEADMGIRVVDIGEMLGLQFILNFPNEQEAEAFLSPVEEAAGAGNQRGAYLLPQCRNTRGTLIDACQQAPSLP